MILGCPVCGGPRRTPEPWEPRCDECGSVRFADAGLIPELDASSRLAAAEARIRELDALVAEARELVENAEWTGRGEWTNTPACIYCENSRSHGKHHESCKLKNWLARTAPKEPEHD